MSDPGDIWTTESAQDSEESKLSLYSVPLYGEDLYDATAVTIWTKEGPPE